MGQLTLHKHMFLLGDKISRLQLLWNGDYFKKMVISVDLAIGMDAKHEYKKRLPLGVVSPTFYQVIKATRHDIDVPRSKLLCPIS